MSRIDDTINKMNGYILEIEQEAIKHTEKLTEEGKTQVKELANRTIDTINSSIKKLNEMKNSVADENDLEDFLNRLEDKCKDVTDFTKDKINEIKPIVNSNVEELKADLNNTFDSFKKGFDEVKTKANPTINRILDNENVQNAIKAANTLKDKAVEFYNDPKTQKAINEAKLKTIELAEKGLDNLKVLLEREDKEN